MGILLDTHVFLWCVQDPGRLTSKAMRHIESAGEDVYVSSASIWELAIKISIGKLAGDVDALAREMREGGYKELAITARHAAQVRHLPFHHHDPFDRILLAQAITEPLHLLTHDVELQQYTHLVELV